VVSALERAIRFRYRAVDVAAILAAGAGIPVPARAGEALIIDLPRVPTRSLADYRWETAR
jgi:hypothetical protein